MRHNFLTGNEKQQSFKQDTSNVYTPIISNVPNENLLYNISYHSKYFMSDVFWWNRGLFIQPKPFTLVLKELDIINKLWFFNSNLNHNNSLFNLRRSQLSVWKVKTAVLTSLRQKKLPQRKRMHTAHIAKHFVLHDFTSKFPYNTPKSHQFRLIHYALNVFNSPTPITEFSIKKILKKWRKRKAKIGKDTGLFKVQPYLVNPYSRKSKFTANHISSKLQVLKSFRRLLLYPSFTDDTMYGHKLFKRLGKNRKKVIKRRSIRNNVRATVRNVHLFTKIKIGKNIAKEHYWNTNLIRTFASLFNKQLIIRANNKRDPSVPFITYHRPLLKALNSLVLSYSSDITFRNIKVVQNFNILTKRNYLRYLLNHSLINKKLYPSLHVIPTPLKTSTLPTENILSSRFSPDRKLPLPISQSTELKWERPITSSELDLAQRPKQLKQKNTKKMNKKKHLKNKNDLQSKKKITVRTPGSKLKWKIRLAAKILPMITFRRRFHRKYFRTNLRPYLRSYINYLLRSWKYKPYINLIQDESIPHPLNSLTNISHYFYSNSSNLKKSLAWTNCLFQLTLEVVIQVTSTYKSLWHTLDKSFQSIQNWGNLYFLSYVQILNMFPSLKHLLTPSLGLMPNWTPSLNSTSVGDKSKLLASYFKPQKSILMNLERPTRVFDFLSNIKFQQFRRLSYATRRSQTYFKPFKPHLTWSDILYQHPLSTTHFYTTRYNKLALLRPERGLTPLTTSLIYKKMRWRRVSKIRARRRSIRKLTKFNKSKVNFFYKSHIFNSILTKFKLRSFKISCDNKKSICDDYITHPFSVKKGKLLNLNYLRKPASGDFRFRLTNKTIDKNYWFLTASRASGFSLSPFFLVQFLSLIKSLPYVRLAKRRKFLYSEPYNFVDYKRLKKTVFNRLIYQRRRANKVFRRVQHPKYYRLDDLQKYPTIFDLPVSPFNPEFLKQSITQWGDKTSYHSHEFRYVDWSQNVNGLEHLNTLFIKKTRFKPGYPRIWREERLVVKDFFKLTHRYQYRLTTKLQWMYWNTRYQYRKRGKYSLKLAHALILTHLATDQWTAEYLLENNYVYLNGSVANNGNAFIFLNDFMQLIISLQFYFNYRWLKSLSLTRFNNWLRRYYKTYRIRRQMFKDFTFRVLPDSVMNLQNSWYDVPRHLEVDYFTLSAFVISTTHNRKVVCFVPFLYNNWNF